MKADISSVVVLVGFPLHIYNNDNKQTDVGF